MRKLEQKSKILKLFGEYGMSKSRNILKTNKRIFFLFFAKATLSASFILKNNNIEEIKVYFLLFPYSDKIQFIISSRFSKKKILYLDNCTTQGGKSGLRLVELENVQQR